MENRGRKSQSSIEYLLLAAFAVIAVIIIVSLVQQNFSESKNRSNESSNSIREFLNSSRNATSGGGLELQVILLTPEDLGSVPSANEVDFSYSTENFTSFFNATLYGNFNGVWTANQSTPAVQHGINHFYLQLADGTYEWNVIVCDISSPPRCASAPANYAFTKG